MKFETTGHNVAMTSMVILLALIAGFGIWGWVETGDLIARQGEKIAKLEADSRSFQNIISQQHQALEDRSKDIHYLQGRLDGSFDIEDRDQAISAVHSMSRILKQMQKYAKPQEQPAEWPNE